MNKLKVYWFLCILSIIIYCLNNVTGAKKGISIDRLEICGKSDNAPFTWDNIEIYRYPNGLSGVYSSGECLRDLPTLYAGLDIRRCSNREALDSCEYITKLRKIDTCKMFKLNNATWSSFMNAFEPPARCPFKKGKFVSKNSTLDPNLIFFIPLENWYWKLLIKVMYDNEYVDVCLDFKTFVIR